MKPAKNRHPWFRQPYFGRHTEADRESRENARRVLRGQCDYCKQNALQDGQECPLCGRYEEK